MPHPSSEKMKVAQIGVGRFGAKRRALMRQTGLFQLEAAFDWNQEALAQAVREDGGRAARSYEEMLDTPGIEAVMVSTGAQFHAEQVVQALDRGLHVFVEKPLCSTPEEMRVLVDAQQRTGLVVGMGHIRHSTDPITRLTQSLIESGELGRILAFEHTVSHSGGWHIKGTWRNDRERNPGGMLFHCGVHEIHELMYLFGPISQVYCALRYDVNEDTETADSAQCLLTFESGLTGTLCTYHLAAYHNTANIYGTDATLYREQGADQQLRLWKQARHLRRGHESREPVELPVERDETGNLRSFYQAVRLGTEPDPSLMDGVRAMSVVFAAVESAEGGQPVRVEQYDPVIA